MRKEYLIYLGFVVLLSSCSSETVEKENKNTESESLSIEKNDSLVSSTISESLPKEFEEIFNFKELFKNEISDVVNTIASEDFELAIKKINHYRNNSDLKLTETQEAYLNFMHIYSTAGLVTQNKKTKEDLSDILNSYRGKNIITHHYEITKGGGMPFNQIQLEQETPGTIKITCANNDGFNILCFVNTEMKVEYDLEPKIGKKGYLCGKLNQYKLSDKDVNSWISSLSLSNGFIKILQDEYESE